MESCLILRGLNNIEKYFKASCGEYINYLLHDGLFNSNKIDKIINYSLYDDSLSLITSYRKLINKDGKYLQDNFRIHEVQNTYNDT